MAAAKKDVVGFTVTRGKKGQSFAAAIVGAEADGDQIELKISWSGSRRATLTVLRDNTARVPLVPTEGAGLIDVSYTASDTGLHHIEVELEFPDEPKPLKKLKLQGRKHGGEFETLDDADESELRWDADGDLA